MLQTGHGDRTSLPGTVRQVVGSLARTPKMPVVNAEVCYEGILEASREEVQRLMFWSDILNGAAGHTYGANGIWQVNTEQQPFGPSPHGRSWGDTPWSVAYRLPGSAQLGLGKALLTRYEWWRFEPHPEWATWDGTALKPAVNPAVLGTSDGFRLIYRLDPLPILLHGLQPGRGYRLRHFDPVEAHEGMASTGTADAKGEMRIPPPEYSHDDTILLAPVR